MISHREFSRLRLSEFVASSEIKNLSDWEFEGRVWVGEAVGFTEWLRPESSPDALCSMALDLGALPGQVAEACLDRIGLPLRPGMTLAEIKGQLGEPTRQYGFVADRTSHEFTYGYPDPYEISCTVLADGGLVHLVVMIPEAAPGSSSMSMPLRGSA